MSDKATTIGARLPRRERSQIELRGEGYGLVRRWVPAEGELDALKAARRVLHEGRSYRYAGTQDWCAVFVLEVSDE